MRQPANSMKQFYRLAIAFIFFTGLFACKKTEVVPYERTSNNTIQEYRVTNAADTLYGAIDNGKNTITLYIPYYIGIEYIVPEIKMDDNARLVDATGKNINPDGGIPPVPIDTTGYKYTVIGSDSSRREYTLIMQIAPHPDSLKAGYQFVAAGSTQIDYHAGIERVVSGRLPIYGNFGSTSTNVAFKLTNQATGKSYTNLLAVYDMAPGAAYYTLQADISPEADSGYYNVEVTHQGRTAKLPPIHLIYRKPGFTNLKSTSSYAPGDTVTFAAMGRNTSDTQNGTIIGLERVYMKFTKSGFGFGGAYPATFPEEIWGQELEMKIVSVSRTEVKVLFPELPAGTVGSYIYSFSLDLPGIAFFFDFKDETGWGKNNMLATIGRLFTIAEKKK